MSQIRSKNTKPEKTIFEALNKAGLKFKRHFKLLGSPDIVFPKEKLAIFIDGEFWHGKNFERRKLTLPEFWVKKIKRNMNRDRKYRKTLKENGWRVIRFWEDRVLKRTDSCIKRITFELSSLKRKEELGKNE